MRPHFAAPSRLPAIGLGGLLALAGLGGFPAAGWSLPNTTAGAELQLLRSVPALTTPDPGLEEALRLEIFPVRVDDGQGHGPDPGSTEWREARTRLVARQCESTGPLRYAHNRIDLDGDGRDEVVATVLGSYTCGTGGCTLFVFRDTPAGLRTVTRMTLFRPPLVVSTRRTNGWNDLILRVRRDAAHGDTMVLRFNGDSYPSNPSGPEAQPLARPQTGTAVLVLEPSPDAGLPLRCKPRLRSQP